MKPSAIPDSPDADMPKNAPIFQRLDQGERFPYPFRFYVLRAVWQCVWLLLFRPSPSRACRWRAFLLRCFGANVATSAKVRGTARIIHPWLLTVGEHSSIGDRVRVYNLRELIIGRQTSISQDVHLCGGTHDHRDPTLPLIRSPITIGSGVWICADAFVGPGVTVGDNAVIGARAVVVKDVAPATIVAGNPARKIGDRFPDSDNSLQPRSR
jgi:putative colanic acid biosynthesis acetyltransferase WcaF